MEQFAIRGGRPLTGSVAISGAKNAALGILAAAVMADEDVIIHNVPDVDDVNILLETIADIGATVERLSRHDVRINGSTLNSCVVDNTFIRKMRGGYYLLGALLGKYHQAEVALPGGCTIGTRPIDQHLKGFELLGARTEIVNGMVVAKADELEGASIYFDTVTVGATINVMLSAVFSKGRTVLENVAKEPHVVDVASCLNSMGAKIKGAGTDLIRIDGVEKLHGTEYTVIPDQIEAGTFLTAAAVTRGDVTVTNVIPKHLDCITSKLRDIGCTIEEYDDAVRLYVKKPLKGTKIRTQPYPGFPTDMQPQMTVVLSTVNGTSTVNETIFENRLTYVDELNRMGTDISVEGNIAIVNGVPKLKGAQLSAPDLRAGAALVTAALAAEGDSVVDEIKYILRGYEDFAAKLRQLGGRIEMVSSETEARKFFMQVV
ncbi:MAG: UDP-N-acetylglucosamine 1-carboxyvinyltransferase [Lachnospiraceae bacterium]|nr:UDP-N-acetylglucosamine 1-carboxyvinyltransferase [Lachnospiraceae bacterium]MBR0086921.1 UDP-N-acetylglucosamine 1-carboxyvinyltransferase [Lachnospiraceae bacterium]